MSDTLSQELFKAVDTPAWHYILCRDAVHNACRRLIEAGADPFYPIFDRSDATNAVMHAEEGGRTVLAELMVAWREAKLLRASLSE